MIFPILIQDGYSQYYYSVHHVPASRRAVRFIDERSDMVFDRIAANAGDPGDFPAGYPAMLRIEMKNLYRQFG